MTGNRMILGGYLSYGVGHHAAAWRLPDVPADAAQSVEHYFRIAEIAEQGLLDFMFLSDTPSVFADDGGSGFGGRVAVFEPLTLLAAIAARTRHLGLIATSSTTYKEPYNLAREYASLDLISGGRAGWNLVTSSKRDAAHNFGLERHPEHSDRYDRAGEFYEVVTSLWDSWEDDAFLRDKATGRFYDPRSRHRIGHKGAHFSVEGPLNISRPIQGHPVIVQAGSSDEGRDLAARTADLVFTAQPDIESGRRFRMDLKNRAARYGRAETDIRVLPGLCVFCGRTDAEARDLLDRLQNLVAEQLGLSMLSDLLGGADLRALSIDGPLPPMPRSNGNRSRQALIETMAARPGMTVRKLYNELVIARGHAVVVGSYETVAQTIMGWFDAGACDGFNIMPSHMPGGLSDFVEGVVPLLQARGFHKTAYTNGTLREKLGLQRPPNRFSRSEAGSYRRKRGQEPCAGTSFLKTRP